MDIVHYVQISKALGDHNRLEIILLLTKGEQCACELLKGFYITPYEYSRAGIFGRCT